MPLIQEVVCRGGCPLGEGSHTRSWNLYAFIFQDAFRFRINGEDVMVDLAEAIENYRWREFEAWLDAHYDLRFNTTKLRLQI